MEGLEFAEEVRNENRKSQSDNVMDSLIWNE
jgi:hypothetical protein